MGMNPQQQRAVDLLEGPLMILAGAGSGKTRVIIHRIANLIRHGVPAANILAVTFTNKAAAEMRQRVAGLLTQQDAEHVQVSTFHSFCLQVLRKFISRLGYSRHFTIATEGYQRGLIREIISENGMTGEGCDPNAWLAIISKAKGKLQKPSDIRQAPYRRAADIAMVYEIYQKKLKQMDLVDFDDLLALTVELWETHPDVLQAYQQVCRYILIDEYQDTNAVQLRIMVMLAGTSRNICVVGDDDQSIYGWRGASLENVLDFETYFPGATVIRLEQNYRSTNTILKAANGLIAHNRKRRAKELWSTQEQGDNIIAVLCENEIKEAEFLCEYIRDQCRNDNWNDFAVLFRAGSQSRALEEAFHRKRIPYTLVGADSFYRRKEVLDAIAFLKVATNPKDDLAMLQIINVPPRGVGDATIEKLRQLRIATSQSIFDLLENESFRATATGDVLHDLDSLRAALIQLREKTFEKNGLLAPLVKETLDKIGYISGLGKMYKPLDNALKRKENVEEFISAIASYDEAKHGRGSLQDYLELIELQDAQDRIKDHTNQKQSAAVNLMTIHASKGLEFPVVMVAGLEQDTFPHKMALDEGNLEEERRLCYVAMTRAQKKLVLTYASRRHIMNRIEPKRPSIFLDEIPEDFLEFKSPEKAIRKCSSDENESFLERLKKLME